MTVKQILSPSGLKKKKRAVGLRCFTLLPHRFINDVAHPFQEEVARLAALQPQVDLLEKGLNELKGEKEGEEDPSAFLDADIDAFKEHYHKVLEDLRARERQLQLGERRWVTVEKLNPSGLLFCAEKELTFSLSVGDPLFGVAALNQSSWVCYNVKIIKTVRFFFFFPDASCIIKDSVMRCPQIMSQCFECISAFTLGSMPNFSALLALFLYILV